MADGAPPPAYAPTPPVAAGENYIPDCNWTLFRSLPNFDLRNGDLTDVTSIFMKATIAQRYHWTPITDLSPTDATAAMDGFIKSHIEQVSANRDVGMTDAQVRKVGIVLGVTRAVSTTFYRLTDGDLVAGETAPAKLIARRGANGEIRYTAAPGVNDAVAVRLNQALALDETEQAVVCALVKCAAGVIPMQGYSLLMTGHHYLSSADSQARKIYMAAEKAYWRSNDVTTWFTEDLAMIQDALWHKACHPVKMNIKEQTSMDPDIAKKLKNANAGACASRLPAAETEIRSANSYMTLLTTVAPMFEMFGGGMDTTALSDLTYIVKSLPVNVANPVLPEEITAAYGGQLTNRETGLRLLEAMLNRNKDRVAFCYGFYMAQADSEAAMGIVAGAGEDTLKTSFSLKKLRGQSHAAWQAGKEAYGDYLAVRNKRRAEGVFDAPAITIS